MYKMLYRLAIFVLAIQLCSSIQAASKPELYRISKSVNLDGCLQGWIDEEDLSFSGLITGNRLTPCAYWKNVYGKGFSAISASVHANGVRIPVVVFFNEADLVSRRTSFDKIVVKLNGGPSGSIGPTPRDAYVAKLALPGTIFVTLGYTGTYYGSLYPKSSFNEAALEINSYVKTIHLIKSAKSIFVIGESLGGRIATYALASSKQTQNYVCGLVLIAPMGRSPSGAILYAQNELYSSKKPSTLINTRIIPSVRSSWSEGKIQGVPSILLLKSFFPKSLYDKNLNYLMKSIKKKNVFLIYGDADNVADWKSLGLVKAGSLHSRQVVQAIGHIPNGQDINKFISYIKDDLSYVCR